jgi:hypothetical protein
MFKAKQIKVISYADDGIVFSRGSLKRLKESFNKFAKRIKVRVNETKSK